MNREPLASHIGTRFQLTLLFADLSGSTAISQSMEPEHYMEVMTEVRAIWRRVVGLYGGHLVRSQGDGALIIFGYPSSTEDDGRRATEAALEIHACVEKLRHGHLPRRLLPLRMHSGIHAGTVLLSPGDIETGLFDLSGEIPNTAAHLAAAAGPGQIFASLAVLGPQANYFDLEMVTWRGNSAAPKDLRAVVRRSGVQNRFEATKKRGLTPLVGRESVVAQIDEFLASDDKLEVLSATPTRCFVLVGSAGLGKTRLLNEMLQQHKSPAVLFMHGTCESHSVPEALQPFTRMVRNYSGGKKEGDPSTVYCQAEGLDGGAPSLVNMLSRINNTPQVRRDTHGIVGELVIFFKTIHKQSNLILVIDDWQWADDASRQLLSALLALPSGPKVLLATRPQENGAIWIHGAPHIGLSPLSEQQTALAVRRWIPHADPFLCESIHTYSGGIPLFIEELCHSATPSDLKKVVGGTGITQSWLGSMVASRLARQRIDLQELIRVCAVIGNTVPLWLLEATIGHLPAAQTLTELEEADFLYPIYLNGQIDSLLFKHGITWEAVYKGIGFQERTLLHLRILDAILALESGTPNHHDVTELLAHHSLGAGRWAAAAQFAEAAGDKSVKAFALDLANKQYKVALDALDRLSESNRDQSLTWCKVAGKLAFTSIFDPLCLGNDLSIFEAAVRVATELQDDNALAQSKYWLGYLQYGLGNLRTGMTTVKEAIKVARQSALPNLIAPFEATLGQILVASCKYDEGLALLSTALASRKLRPERAKGSVVTGSAYSLAISGFAYADRGQFDEAHQLFDEAIELLDGTTHPIGNSVRNFICVSYIWQGKWSDAERIALESKQIAENSRTLLQLASSSGLLHYIDWATGKDRASLDRFKETLVWMDEHQSSFYTSLYFGFLTHACAVEGQVDEARKYAMRVAIRRKEGETLGVAIACRAMASLSAAAGKPALARRWMARAEKSAVARNSPRDHLLNSLMLAKIT